MAGQDNYKLSIRSAILKASSNEPQWHSCNTGNILLCAQVIASQYGVKLLVWIPCSATTWCKEPYCTNADVLVFQRSLMYAYA